MILNIPARGFGPSASIPFVVTRGYSIGASVAVPILEICTIGQYVNSLTSSGQYVSSLTSTGQCVNSLTSTGEVGVC